MQTITTKKGTVLPLLDLKGKPYLQVAHRLVWFREEHPEWSIETEVKVHADGKSTIAKATIKNSEGKIVSTAHKAESEASFFDHTEKAETGAIGRALGYSGYGTQFDPGFDEGERIVDSPVGKNETDSRNNKLDSIPAQGLRNSSTTFDKSKPYVPTPGKKCSDKQLQWLLDACHKVGYTERLLNAKTEQEYGISNWKNIDQVQQHALINEFKAMYKAKQGHSNPPISMNSSGGDLVQQSPPLELSQGTMFNNDDIPF